jgi:hypothetical protein
VGQAGGVPVPDLTRTSSILPQDKHLYSNRGIVISLLIHSFYSKSTEYRVGWFPARAI